MQYCLHWVLLTSVFAGKFYLRFFSVAIRVSLFSFKRTLLLGFSRSGDFRHFFFFFSLPRRPEVPWEWGSGRNKSPEVEGLSSQAIPAPPSS